VLAGADLVVIILFLLAALVIGFWFGRGEKTTGDYFLGGRKQHWFIVGLSIIATEVSAVTFIAVPEAAFTGDWTYLQMYAGAFLGRLLIIWLLLPAFYRESVTTVYVYLGRRFGPCTRVTAALFFFASRIIGSGLRLLVASVAVAEIFGWPLHLVILGAAILAVVYTTFGGIKAIIWTDALQALIFVVAGVVAVVCLMHAIPGTAAETYDRLTASGKLNIFTWSGSWNSEKLFWALLISATFTNMAALGTDQDLTQRMLTCADVRKGQRSLLFNAFLGLPIVILFLFIGSLLFAYYGPDRAAWPPAVAEKTVRAFPWFIANGLPAGTGLQGLLITGVLAAVLSSLDSALGALSSTAVTDFYRPFFRRNATERHYLAVSRLSTLVFGALLVLVAFAFADHAELLWVVFKWAGLVFGGMLGIFLLGVLTRTRGRDGLNVPAMLLSVAVLVTIKLCQEPPLAKQGEPLLGFHLAWPWWIVLGTTITFAVGACFKTPDHVIAPRTNHAPTPTP